MDHTVLGVIHVEQRKNLTWIRINVNMEKGGMIVGIAVDLLLYS